MLEISKVCVADGNKVIAGDGEMVGELEGVGINVYKCVDVEETAIVDVGDSTSLLSA